MSEVQTIGNESGTVRGLTASQQNTLVTLAEESMYDLATKCHLESYYDTEVNHGHLYPNFDSLVEMGLAEKSELDKRTDQYELVGDGLQAALDRFSWMLMKFITDDKRAEIVSELVENKP